MSAVTQWFSSEQKPRRAGLYETNAAMLHVGSKRTSFQYWNGEFWGVWFYSVQEFTSGHNDPDSYVLERSVMQKVQWRGLAEKPEAA